jgi:hypothetical protein
MRCTRIVPAASDRARASDRPAPPPNKPETPSKQGSPPGRCRAPPSALAPHRAASTTAVHPPGPRAEARRPAGINQPGRPPVRDRGRQPAHAASGGLGRSVAAHCRASIIPESLRDLVPLFLKRQCDRTPGKRSRPAAMTAESARARRPTASRAARRAAAGRAPGSRPRRPSRRAPSPSRRWPSGPARGPSRALSVLHSKSVTCGGFAWARRALNRRKRRFPAPPGRSS